MKLYFGKTREFRYVIEIVRNGNFIEADFKAADKENDTVSDFNRTFGATGKWTDGAIKKAMIDEFKVDNA